MNLSTPQSRAESDTLTNVKSEQVRIIFASG